MLLWPPVPRCVVTSTAITPGHYERTRVNREGGSKTETAAGAARTDAPRGGSAQQTTGRKETELRFLHFTRLAEQRGERNLYSRTEQTVLARCHLPDTLDQPVRVLWTAFERLRTGPGDVRASEDAACARLAGGRRQDRGPVAIARSSPSGPDQPVVEAGGYMGRGPDSPDSTSGFAQRHVRFRRHGRQTHVSDHSSRFHRADRPESAKDCGRQVGERTRAPDLFFGTPRRVSVQLV